MGKEKPMRTTLDETNSNKLYLTKGLYHHLYSLYHAQTILRNVADQLEQASK